MIQYLYSSKCTPIKRHNSYMVPCFETNGYYVPIYPVRHNDKESGQLNYHYHVDTRFLQTNQIAKYASLRVDGDVEIIYKKFKCQRIKEIYQTNIAFISNTKGYLKYQTKQCVNLDKCPHKGYDLSTVPIDVDGYKTCPLHGMRIKIDRELAYNKI